MQYALLRSNKSVMHVICTVRAKGVLLKWHSTIKKNISVVQNHQLMERKQTRVTNWNKHQHKKKLTTQAVAIIIMCALYLQILSKQTKNIRFLNLKLGDAKLFEDI